MCSWAGRVPQHACINQVVRDVQPGSVATDSMYVQRDVSMHGTHLDMLQTDAAPVSLAMCANCKRHNDRDIGTYVKMFRALPGLQRS